MTTIIHLADIHIKSGNSRDEEYTKVFKNLNESIKTITGKKIIVIAGDLFDEKDKTLADGITKTNNFIKSLLEHGDVVLINGNHDMNEKQPLINCPTTALNKTNKLHYLTENKVYENEELSKNIKFVLTNRFTEEVTTFVREEKKIYIGLYHGGLKDVFKMMECKFETKDFENYDLVMLGDIHRKMEVNEKIAYPSSLIQQRFGENFTHGYYKYTINNRTNKIVREYVKIRNENCFAIFKIKDEDYELETDDGTTINDLLEYTHINSKLKFKTSEVEKVDKIILRITQKFGNKIVGNIKLEPHDDSIQTQQSYTTENIYELLDKANEKLFKEDEIKYCKLIREKLINEKIILNALETRKIRLIKLEFENLTCFGLNNVIMFDKMRGITGINATNGYGKTTIIEALLYGLYDKSPRDNILLSKGKQNGIIILTLLLDNKTYKITKKLKQIDLTKKYIQTEIILEELIENDIYKIVANSKNSDTNNIIHSLFGDYDTAIRNNIILAQPSFSFTAESDTEKKNIIDKTFNLDGCSEISKYAISENTTIRGKIADEQCNIKKFLNAQNVKKILIEYLTNKNIYNDLTIPFKNTISEPLKTRMAKNNLILSKLDSINETQVTQYLTEILKEIDDSINTTNRTLYQLQNNLEDFEKENFEYSLINNNINDVTYQITTNNSELLRTINQLTSLEHIELIDIEEHRKSELFEEFAIKKLDDEINDNTEKINNILTNNIKNYDLLKFRNDIREITTIYNNNIAILTQENEKITNITYEELLNMQNDIVINKKLLENIKNQYSDVLTCKYSANCECCNTNKKIIESSNFYNKIENLELKCKNGEDIKKQIELFHLKFKTDEYLRIIQEHNNSEKIIKTNEKYNKELEIIRNTIQQLKYERTQRKNIYDNLRNANYAQTQKKDLLLKRDRIEKNLKLLEETQLEYERIQILKNNQLSILQRKQNIINEIEAKQLKNESNSSLSKEISSTITIIKNSQKNIKAYGDEHNKNISVIKYYDVEIFYGSIFKLIESNCNSILKELSVNEVSLTYAKKILETKKISSEINVTCSDGRDSRSLSSSEEFITNVVMRLCLCVMNKKVSSGYFIIDEGFTTICDEKLADKAGILLSYLKKNFKCVLIVSHLPKIKAYYDSEIKIEQNNGISRLV